MHELIDRVFDDPADRRPPRADCVERDRQARVVELAVGQAAPARRRPACPTSTRAASCGRRRWSTRTTVARSTSPLRRRLLDAIDAVGCRRSTQSGAAKLLVTSRALRLRRDHPELFSRYTSRSTRSATPPHHVVAFDRGEAIAVATRLPIGLAAAGGWGDTAIVLAGRPYVDVLTGRVHPGGTVPAADLLDRYPVALLAPESVVG